MDKALPYFKYLFRILIVGYTVVTMYYFLGKPAGSGDEALFLADLQLISQRGWSHAIAKGISLPYMVLTYPVSKMVSGIVALRGVNILLFLGLVAYFKMYRKVKGSDFYFLLLFFYSSLGYFMVGTNDTLFIVSMTVFLAETHFLLSSEPPKKLFFWGLGLVIAFFTREMVLLYLPVVAWAVFLVLKRKGIQWKSLTLPFVLGLVLFALNYPSLSAKGKLSYDLKLPPSEITATWPQRQYLAQLWVNEGKLKNYNHPTWIQTQKYLDKNGANALPKTIFSSLLFHLPLTFKEFVKDFIYILQYSVRSMGLMLVLSLFFGVRFLLKQRKVNEQTFLPVAVLLIMGTFAFVIISFIELRWLAAPFLAIILYFHQKSTTREIPRVWQWVNSIFIALLCLYGSYGILLKTVWS
ncbi:MAG: hypothetical protein R2793_00920 [Flavobacteriaceae bacterium]